MSLKKITEAINNLNIQAKSALWFAMCSILQKGISVITVPVFTRLLTPEEYGVYSIFLSWLMFISVFTSLNLFYGVFNNAMLKYENDRDRYISSMQGLVCCTTLFVFLLYWSGRNHFNNWLGLSTTMMLIMFIDLLVTPALQFWSARQRFEYKYKLLVGVTMLQAIMNPALGVIAVMHSNQKDLARIIAIVVVDVVICGTIAVLQFYKGKCFFNKEYWKYAFFFNIPLIPHYLSGILLNQGDRIMIDNMVGKYEVATYSVAYNIGMLLNIVLMAINGAFTPWMYTELRKRNYFNIKKMTNVLMIIMSILLFVLIAFAPEMIRIFATSDYYEAVYVIPPVAGSVFFNLMYAFFSNVEFYYEKNKFVMIASMGAAILNIVLNAIFIPLYGYLAAGYTTLASYLIYCLAHYIFCTIVCKNHHIQEEVFDKKFLLILSMAVVTVSIGFSALYRYMLIRYIVIFIVAAILVAFKNKIVELLYMLKAIKSA